MYVFDDIDERTSIIIVSVLQKKLCTEDQSLMRTIDRYEDDIKCLTASTTGVKGKCVFNELYDFHVIENVSLDIMHDLFEGMCNYVMFQVLISLIFTDKCFSVQYLNYRLKIMDFCFESANVPLEIRADYLKTNNRLKMSASEMLIFYALLRLNSRR